METSNNSSPNLIIYLCKIEWVEFKDIFIWDVCRYLGFFSASIFHFYLYFSHLKRFFLDAAARMPTKVENHIPGLSPGNFLCKLLEISSEISWQCKAGILESTYKWTNQIIYSNKISQVRDPKQSLW
jgi:hypothetical protein